ncbi:MAG: hypothetical protein GF331_20035 [Chitinivibrionales bacterium]|nr:hypothetical protein [Chitinivibrionales bacterium]
MRTETAVLLLIGLAAMVQPGATPLTAAQQAAVGRISENMLASRYAVARAMADSAMATPGADPIFPMLKLMIVGLREMDFETVIDSGEFEATADAVLEELDSLEAQEENLAYARTIRGFVLATRAAYDLRRDRHMRAVRGGLDALRMLEEAAQGDSTIADADYFLGLYDWSRSDLRRRLWWVLFWLPGNRERGVSRLERCRREGLFCPIAAAISLVEVYARSGKFERARELLDTLLMRFPHSRFVLWAEVKYYLEREEHREAAKVYAKLAESYGKERYGAYNAAFCGLQGATLLYESDDVAGAAAACRKLLSRREEGDDSRVADIRDDARELLERTERDGTGGS